MKQKLSKLEALRGFAAVYVVLHHTIFSKDAKPLFIFGKNLCLLFRFGQEAVILFFFLSGFVIHFSFSKTKDQSAFSFVLKRFLRIYIPLILVFIVNYVLYSVTINHNYHFEWGTLFGNLFMLQDDFVSLKPNVISGTFLNNLPLWSLAYEWWFYMIYIFLMKKSVSNTSYKVYIIGTLATITYLFYPNFLNRELMYLIIWWVGTDMADLYLLKKDISFKNLQFPITALGLNTIFLVINARIHHNNLSIGYSPYLELRHFGFAFFAVFIALIWKRLKWVGFKYSIGLFEIVAPISFAIYISHWFLIRTANYFNSFIQNRFLLFTSYAIVCILFSFLIERVIYVRLNKLILSKLVKREESSRVN